MRVFTVNIKPVKQFLPTLVHCAFKLRCLKQRSLPIARYNNNQNLHKWSLFHEILANKRISTGYNAFSSECSFSNHLMFGTPNSNFGVEAAKKNTGVCLMKSKLICQFKFLHQPWHIKKNNFTFFEPVDQFLTREL